ncbi:hydrogenase maturation nickel metallochaperone HypA [Streptantibioticus ferralitis]|uniref:Hydrogenase maturation factor HypA n=1 Tax=Streptantibioticus ferralitis TaxID=236510 RepID=A0ABT5YTP0_9ACTN|nr:hydrogenase maturation nickel metallochaperone HypA [Streptantibioticus ferralitis]MDF2254981.1 hydrogenase maturation nickel metallochaperone HypA [Streptantibioticus ferralitis]
MHEMSIAMAVVEQVAAAARDAGVDSVQQVRLEVGELAGVVPDALDFSFELACAGTALEGAELIAEPVPGRARCEECRAEWPTGMPPQLRCPRCAVSTGQLLSGRELRITSVRWAGEPEEPEPVRVREEC